MELTASTVLFYVFAAIAIVFSVLTVTSTKIMRSATYLLFVLIASAGLYILLNYHFIAAVQISVYAGGIVILYVFGILLTSAKGDRIGRGQKIKIAFGTVAAAAAFAITLWIIFTQPMLPVEQTLDVEINMKEVGHALLGTGKHQYLLPFEAVSILLLACIIGGILIARKR